ncbi:hypothetical protein MY4038_004852 [Beauveria bassiana]
MVSCVVPQGSFGWFWKLLPTTDLKGKSDRVFENKASSTISTARLQSLSRLQTISPCPLRLFRGNPSGDELGEQGVTRILLFGVPKLPLPVSSRPQHMPLSPGTLALFCLQQENSASQFCWEIKFVLSADLRPSAQSSTDYTMPPKKDAVSSGGKGEGRGQNGNRPGFRTDTAISNRGAAGERVLQPWVPDASDGLDASLEGSTSSGAWDQFAANERLFGVKTDYDENIYTTSINKSHPQYRERIAAADRKAREIERSAPTTAHVAEERVMDYNGSGGGDDNEEEKYSGVRRQDFPPLGGGRENRYTPPAKRAPAAQSNVKGAPVDPAIISAQIKAPYKKPAPAAADQTHGQPPDSAKNATTTRQQTPKTADSQPTHEKSTEAKVAQSKDFKSSDTRVTENSSTAATTTPVGTKVGQGAADKATVSATLTVERDVLNSFKTFATQQRINAEKVRNSKAKADKEVKLTELRKFATSFKLSTPVPNDLVSIIAKDPVKQKEIQARAIRNAEEVAAKSKADSSSKSSPASGKGTPPKVSDPGTTMPPSVDPRNSRAPAGPHGASPAGAPNRHTGPRQPYPQQYHGQGYRNNRGGLHNMPPQQTGSLAQRLRNVEQQKFSQPPTVQQPPPSQDARAPPTGPSGTNDTNFSRRHSALPGHMGVKLNPNSHEFRPSPFAPSFNPNNHASAGSSPRSAVNNVPDANPAAAVHGQLIRRKTKAVDVNKCSILSHIKTVAPPPGRKWDDNGGLRPAYDTLPTWRQLRDDEKADSTMHLTYKEYFERSPFSGPAMATPNTPHALPHLAHQHQLPFHLQHGSLHTGQRQSPAMPPMQMHTPHHGPPPHSQYGNDDHRMMHSNSQQSFASPRMAQMPMAYNSPSQMAYNQPVYMGGGALQMGQYRSFSNSHHPHYAPPQAHMMMPQHFMPAPQGMVGGPQMMYPGAHGQFMSPGGPQQPGPGANGYPSPGRPSAPAMVHQGSQQGQPMYGMSPSVQYNQPAHGQVQGGAPSQ